jgi:GNAT superfamily N-acetyltransferase
MIAGLIAPALLTADHDVSGFDCGKPSLNHWLKRHALSNQAKGFTRVLVIKHEVRVVAYYGVAPTAVPAPVLPRSVKTGQPPDPVPCLLLAQFAIDLAYQGRGIGSALLADAISRCIRGAELMGGRAVIVRAVDDEAAAYWVSNGFRALGDDPMTLVQTIPSLAGAFATSQYKNR